MLKMKLPLRTGEGRGGDAAEDESPVPGPGHGERPAPGAPGCPSRLDKESVFEWFGLHLHPARRLEFMCGLLHMCQPLELRFLGSYLEDLARKDHHVLRDFECRANGAGELALLADAADPVVRSKLLVCLSLLRSDNRECAAILFRVLSRVDPPPPPGKGCPPPASRDPQRLSFHPPCPDGGGGGGGPEPAAGALEQLALLLTMASLHPAFHFHQREVVRELLDKMEPGLEEERARGRGRGPEPGQPTELLGPSADFLPAPPLGLGECPAPPLGLGECPAPHPPCQSRRSSRWAAQREAVHIEGIVLTHVSRTRADKEYKFEVTWSDSSSTSVTKTHQELENFLLQLPKDQNSQCFEKSLLRLLNQGDQYQTRDLDKHLRERFLSAPPLFRKTRNVCSFFNCDSSSSVKPACCRCSCTPGPKVCYQEDCSDASSQEEEPYVQGHKKKHGSKSPCQPAKSPPAVVRRGLLAAELNGPAERRKKNNALRSNQEVEQHLAADKRIHPAAKSKSRVPATDREKGKMKVKGAAFIANGSLVPPHRKDGGSGPDTFGETSSESYSSPSSPQHRESLDSEDDNNKDTDSHSDDGGKGAPVFFSRQVEAEFPPLSFLHPPPPYALPNGGADPPGLPQSIGEGKQSSGPLVMPMPPAMPGPGLAGDPEKREVLPTFGVSPLGLHPAGSPGVLVQRFKTSQGPGEAPPHHQAPVRGLGMAGPLLPCPDPANAAAAPLQHVDTPHAKHPGIPLPSGLPSPYALPPPATAPSPGHIQAAVPPAVPTHTPGPAPSPSPALTHSTAHIDCTSYSNSSASCGSAAVAPPQQQQTATPTQQGCGICGCHNNCGGRGGAATSAASSCQTPLFFPAHQMAAARQVFGVPAPLFQLTSLGSSSYLTPAHQANGAAALSPFFPAAPPPPYMHSHPHSHADVPSHMLGTQAAAVAAAAAACYGLQQQMAPAAGFCQRVYQHVYPNPLGLLAATAALGSGGVNKKSGNVSCYNCGVSGHYAQDCNQPAIDATQQGGFRLKYAAAHVPEALDNGD